MRYLKGQAWLTLKAATGIIDHGVKTRISVEQRVKALVSKKNRRFPPLEIARKCQISKSNSSIWICDACRQWGYIANTIFTQKVPNQVFESFFQPLGVISHKLFTKWYCVTFWVGPFLFENLKICLTISKSSHLRCAEVNCITQSIFPHLYCREKLNFELCKHGSNFSLLRIKLS